MLNNDLRGKIQEALLTGKTVTEVSKEFGVLRPTVAYIEKQLSKEPREDLELFEAGVTLERKVQRLQDTQRIERKLFREQARLDNIAEDLFTKVLEKIGESKVELPIIEAKEEGKVGLFIFNDTHIGEVVDLPINSYNLDIARERILQYTLKTIKMLDGMGVKEVRILFLGDITNADNHLDKLLSNACSRAESLVHAFNIFSEVIELVSNTFNISGIHLVVGNESRCSMELSSLDRVLINNLDYLLYEFLRSRFSGLPFDTVDYHSVIEKVININGKNILITHGIWNSKDLDTLDKRREYRNSDYAICGHIHAPALSGRCARGGSLVGANSYSYHNLSINSSIKSGLVLVVDEFITPILVEV